MLRLESKACITAGIKKFICSNSRKAGSDLSYGTTCTFPKRGSTKTITISEYVRLEIWKDEHITIECIITILKPSRLARSIAVPSSNLSQDFGSLLESKKGTDIIFEVNGEIFNAHRCVLAARSPVFEVELFGHMKEKTSPKIKVTEIQPLVFKAMLHFIYTDSLPDLRELNIDSSEENSTAMAHHLLVAADRYSLERLKFICTDMLYKNVKKENIVATLVLAERHSCFELKDACIEFIATSMNLRDIMMADGFDDLVQNCPSVLKELREKFSSI